MKQQYVCDMANFDKLYRQVALEIIHKCHGGIKIKKHGKIILVYDPNRHIWSSGLIGLMIREECKNANLRDWESANVRSNIVKILLSKSLES